MKERFKLSIALTLLALLTAGGCGSSASLQTENSADEFEDLISVGFSQIGSESLWRDANTQSIQAAFTKENGYFLLFNNARQKQENQIKAIRSFISQRVDYILFSPVTQDGWETVLQEAADAQIPVVVVDRKMSEEYDELYTAWVGTDSREEGRSAGKGLEAELAERGMEEEEIRIVVLTGTVGSSAQVGRSEGFSEIARQHENWTILAEDSGEFTTARGKEVMEDYLERYPQIDVLISQNDDMTLGALEALEEAGVPTGENGMIIISFDAAKEALKLVQQGSITIDVECNALQGPYIEEFIRRMEAGEEIQKENIVPEEVFTRDNVDEAIEMRQY